MSTKQSTKPEPGEKLIASNKKAQHDYFILQKFEAGIALMGTELKSLRGGKAQLKDSYVLLKDGEAFLFGAHISPYTHGNIYNHDPERTRKLLLHRKEIEKLLTQESRRWAKGVLGLSELTALLPSAMLLQRRRRHRRSFSTAITPPWEGVCETGANRYSWFSFIRHLNDGDDTSH